MRTPIGALRRDLLIGGVIKVWERLEDSQLYKHKNVKKSKKEEETFWSEETSAKREEIIEC